MSLYDGLGLDSKEKAQCEQQADLMGWSSGIKLLQSQLQLKKAALTQAKREQIKKGTVLPPVVDLKSRKDDSEDTVPAVPMMGFGKENKGGNNTLLGGDWDLRHEYDPLWPNDYDNIMRDRADREKKQRDKEREREREQRNRERDRDRGDRDRDRERDRDYDRERDREYDEERSSRRDSRYNRRERHERRELERPPEEDFDDDRLQRRAPNVGAAIAPPPSLMESADRMPLPTTPFTTGSSVAARIMAKYGFREGQGLGKKEQGMSQALQVEKTSKRGGKIIHEKDLAKIVAEAAAAVPTSPPLLPFATPPPPLPPPGAVFMSSTPDSPIEGHNPQLSVQVDSITEIMKHPSKVVLLRNMVGPGEVDEELEPETKEECGKYGDVIKCVICEIPGGKVADDEAVRIFIEFKRLESAIKAVVDLNGRYFGGRVVKAGFYEMDKFKRLELA